MSSRLEEIEQRLAGRTGPEPWVLVEAEDDEEQSVVLASTDEVWTAVIATIAQDSDLATDGALIAHAPADLEYLLRIARAAQEVARTPQGGMRGVQAHNDLVNALEDA